MDNNNNEDKLDVNKALQPLRVGIICGTSNKEDLLHYKNELASIKTKLKGMVKIVIFGYDTKENSDNWLKDVDFEFVKPTSIIHYFKQLKALNLDLLFIPLIKNEYNVTSEDYSKYFEAGLFEIPVITTRMYPYNSLIVDKRNGFLFDDEHELIPYLEHLHTQRALVKHVGIEAKNIIEKHYNYSIENIKTISDLFEL